MIITQTPLRISFAGGGTDYPSTFEQHGGAVCSSAIDKFVYCIVKERFDDKIYVNWSKKEIVDTVDQIEHDLVREAMRKVGVTKAVEIAFLSDIPSEGSGLGSSSTVTVAVLHALRVFLGETPTMEQLAREACDIEINQLGKPIGVQDQYIAAYGGLRHLQFGPGKEIKATPVNISRGALEDLDNMLMLFFTGKTRKADTILAKQKANLTSQVDTILQMTGQAAEVRQLFERGDVAALGPLLYRGWEAKRRLTSGATSNSELDEMYERAMKAGCLGGKIAGAGGGGFFLLCVPSDRRQAVRAALSDLKEMPFRLERGGSRVVLNMQRY